MAIYYLKKGKTAADKALDDAQVSEVVKNTLKVIEDRGDAAVREFSEKFDNYSPKSYKPLFWVPFESTILQSESTPQSSKSSAVVLITPSCSIPSKLYSVSIRGTEIGRYQAGASGDSGFSNSHE